MSEGIFFSTLLVGFISSPRIFSKLFDHLEKCDYVSDFLCDFRLSQSFADLLTSASDKILRAFNSVWLLKVQHIIHSRFLTGFSMLTFFANSCLIEIQIDHVELFCLFTVIDGFEWF